MDYDLFVSSRNTHSVKRFDGITGAFLGDFVQPNAGGLNTPQEVAFGPDGHLYVSGRGNTAILKYNSSTGAFLGAFTSGYLLQDPTKMTFGPDGFLYVSQWGVVQKKVARFDAFTGVFEDEFTSIDLVEGCGHAWDADTNLYVASFGSADVRKFDRNGTFIAVVNQSGFLAGAVNVFIGDSSDVFVVDWNSGSVMEFDGTTGDFESTFISGMVRTEGVTVGPDGNFYLCDWSQNEIVAYDSSGSLIGVFTDEGGMLQPNSLVFGPSPDVTGVDRGRLVPAGFELFQNHPNPFNPATQIRYSLPEPAHVVLTIYDMLGHPVETIYQGNSGAHTHSVTWWPSGLASGVYFYRIDAGRFSDTKKLLLLK